MRLTVPYRALAVSKRRGFKRVVLAWGSLVMGLAGGQAGLAKAAAACGAGTAMGGHWPETAAAEELLAEPEPRPVTTMLATFAA